MIKALENISLGKIYYVEKQLLSRKLPFYLDVDILRQAEKQWKVYRFYSTNQQYIADLRCLLSL
jgi:hypothetical protein